MKKKKQPKESVRKSNSFVYGQYRFGLNEQKILLSVLSRIKPNDKEFHPYVVPWSEIKRITNNRLNTVSKMRKSCESLKNKTVVLMDGKKEVGFGFLSGWTIDQGRSVEFRIDPGMKSLLLDLLEHGNFTLYDLECVLSLTSVYSIRIYELLKSHEFKKQPIIIPLKDLKWSLDITLTHKSYTDFCNFRQRILDKAQLDLKKHTDLSFTYKTIKENRRVVALEITIKENKSFQRTIQGKEGAKSTRQSLKNGDVVLIAGKEYVLTGNAVMMSDGAIPIGKLNELVKKGKVLKKQ